MPQQWTDRELYETLCHKKSDQQEAYDFLFKALYPYSFYILNQPFIVDLESAAEGCTHDGIISAWMNCASCKAPDKFYSYVKTAVINRTLNEYQRQKHRPALSIDEVEELVPESGNSPEMMFLEQEKYAGLIRLLKLAPLSDLSKYVIAARYLENLTDHEICERLLQSAGQTITPPRVQETRSKNIKKIKDNPNLLNRFRSLR